MRWLLTSALLFSSCDLTGLDPEDCGFFSAKQCEWYLPEGLTCGLAHRDQAHSGGSCALEYDPALTFREGARAEVAAGRLTTSQCPEDYIAASVLDEDVDDQWWFCAASGNTERSSADLSELPAGAVCGLSKPRTGEGSACMGSDPTLGECPDGFVFRWVVERGVLSEDASCQTTGEGDGVPGNGIARILTFCELEEVDETGAPVGCVEEGGLPCPPERSDPGILCGLHVRTLSAEEPLDLLEDDIRFSSTGPASAMEYAESCSPYWPHLTEGLLEAMRAHAPANLTPRCKGVDLASGCPGGMSMTCTSDVFGATTSGEAFSRMTLCWCADTGSAQTTLESD